MSTNFYYRIEKGPLSKLEPLHIGLCLPAHIFHFKAYTIEAQVHTLTDTTGQLRMKVKMPALSLKSAADWRAFMKENDGVVLDEVGTPITIEDFWALVQEHSKQGKFSSNVFFNRPILEQGPGEDMPDITEWRDGEGFAVSRVNAD